MLCIMFCRGEERGTVIGGGGGGNASSGADFYALCQHDVWDFFQISPHPIGRSINKPSASPQPALIIDFSKSSEAIATSMIQVGSIATIHIVPYAAIQ